MPDNGYLSVPLELTELGKHLVNLAVGLVQEVWRKLDDLATPPGDDDWDDPPDSFFDDRFTGIAAVSKAVYGLKRFHDLRPWWVKVGAWSSTDRPPWHVNCRCSAEVVELSN